MNEKFDKILLEHAVKAFEAYQQSVLDMVDKMPDDPVLRRRGVIDLSYNLVLKIISELTILHPRNEFADSCTSLQLNLAKDLFDIYNETHDARLKEAENFKKQLLED